MRVNTRESRGRELVKAGMVEVEEVQHFTCGRLQYPYGVFRVGRFEVIIVLTPYDIQGTVSCQCPDFNCNLKRESPCKHIVAALFFARANGLTEEKLVPETEVTVYKSDLDEIVELTKNIAASVQRVCDQVQQIQ